MTDAVQVALIVALAPTIASLASLVASLRNHDKLKTLEIATNGMQSKLETAAEAKGKLAGAKEQRESDAQKP